MGKSSRLRNLALLLAGVSSLAFLPARASAEDLSNNAKYAAIVVDAQSGEVFYAKSADSARYPASLTKIMTLYMAFDALAQGKLRPDDTITMSAKAVSQAPVKVYLREGDTIDVDTAMRLIALYSANDLAEALSEKIGGTEERFAAMMTIRAQELGMTQTRFVNANGLPDARQLSSARDLAILARAIMRDYPQYYGYFNIDSMEYRGHVYMNHNPLHGIPGVDGMKTGFTNAAGYNLVASQVKDGHRLIAVMLGGSNKAQRRENVIELMNTGFDVIDRRAHGELIAVAQSAFTHAAVSNTPYTLLASNAGPAKPLTDAELRDTLAASEQANATDDDVEQASAKVNAPGLAQTLSQSSAQKSAPAVAAAAPTYAVLHNPATDPTDDSTAAAAPAPIKASLTETTKADAKKPLTKAEARAEKKKKKNPDAIWSIQVGAFKQKSLAANWVKDLQHRFDTALADSRSEVTKTDEGWYRTRFASLTKEQAHQACHAMSAKRLDCMVIKPDEG